MSNVLEFTEHAAAQNDRWLLVALAALCCSAVVFLWRWMVHDRERVAARLEMITDRHIEAQKELSSMVARATFVIENNTRAITDVAGCLSEQARATAACLQKNYVDGLRYIPPK